MEIQPEPGLADFLRFAEELVLVDHGDGFGPLDDELTLTLDSLPVASERYRMSDASHAAALLYGVDPVLVGIDPPCEIAVVYREPSS